MQSMEAIISLFFFVALSTSMLLQLDSRRDVDDSLYRAQLAEDAWRVLWLRGDFAGFGNTSLLGTDAEMDRELAGRTRADVDALGSETGLCVFLAGVVSTNCRGVPGTETTVSVERTVIYRGMPSRLTLSMKK